MFQEGGHDSKNRLDSYNNGVKLVAQEVLSIFICIKYYVKHIISYVHQCILVNLNLWT